ncbi:hypothetical protein DVH24_000302 [Malus domestica]|uniref:Uncharacterized protein n=1 Tax=Malus domestica TaxID=3750 RepID=A0A498J4B7_MALDO|nr:hypothetical protein DVH24_000302 [Malus domestica]
MSSYFCFVFGTRIVCPPSCGALPCPPILCGHGKIRRAGPCVRMVHPREKYFILIRIRIVHHVFLYK